MCHIEPTVTPSSGKLGSSIGPPSKSNARHVSIVTVEMIALNNQNYLSRTIQQKL